MFDNHEQLDEFSRKCLDQATKNSPLDHAQPNRYFLTEEEQELIKAFHRAFQQSENDAKQSKCVLGA